MGGEGYVYDKEAEDESGASTRRPSTRDRAAGECRAPRERRAGGGRSGRRDHALREEIDADLIVVGTHLSSWAARWYGALVSSADRHSSCSVLVAI
jgi:nucleotide-binding universal stress UspA family protein